MNKKLLRKNKKHQHTLTKETGVICCDFPTKHLAICNAGQINGITEEILVESFKYYGDLDKVLLLPGKSCSFVSFKTVTSAEVTYVQTNGKLNIAQDGKPIFLSYVETLPNFPSTKIWDRLPPGLIVLNDFITKEEEATLLSLYQFKGNSDGNMKYRQVKHYGYEFRYDINNVDKDKPLNEKIPAQCNFLWDRLNRNFYPDQLTVNCYEPGQGIPHHIDTHSAFEDPIISLSLGSPVVMEFKKSNETICVLLPQRSLTIISGESRYAWTHGIIPRKFDFYYNDTECNSFKRDTRVSFTFRKILRGECCCNYKLNCDSNNIQIGNAIASDLEDLHVHGVYEDIATHFSETRHKPWPNVLNFLNSLDKGAILVDVGCGNGKYLGHHPDIYEMGTDRSFKLNELCKSRGFEIFTANCLHIPLKNNIADGVISIAVIHHLSTKERRLQALCEISRILRIGGKALIYVWAKEQVINKQKSTYIKQDRKNRKSENIQSLTKDVISVAEGVSLPIHTNRTDFNHSDVLVPWKLKSDQSQTYLRFYHVFEEGELENLCKNIQQIEIIKSYYDQGNYCIIFEKKEHNLDVSRD